MFCPTSIIGLRFGKEGLYCLLYEQPKNKNTYPLCKKHTHYIMPNSISNSFITYPFNQNNMAEDYTHNYLEFASNISFLEFLQEEFKKPHFKSNKYQVEIEKLSEKGMWDTEELSSFLKEHPKSFEIFEEIFQLARFTNTQLIHFLFNTKILNSTDENNMIEYLKKNLEFDKFFTDTFIKQSKKMDFDNLQFKNLNDVMNFIDNKKDKNSKNYPILLLKATVMNYIESAVKNAEIVHERISNPYFRDVADRTAKYLINNLHLNEVLKGIKIKEYLESKRIPIDTKSIHGAFGRNKISQILEKHEFVNADPFFDKNNIKTLTKGLSSKAGLKELKDKFVYVTEKYLEGIIKRKDRKPKKFDFILLFDLKPKIVIETNFYSTAGTKIGINQGEYIDLNEDIKRDHNYLIFIWITDGNYWLTSDGKNRLSNLYNYFGDYVLNYNLFDKKLEELKKELK